MRMASIAAGLAVTLCCQSALADENSKYRTVDGGYAQNGEISSYRSYQVHEHDLAWMPIDDKCFPVAARKALPKSLDFRANDFALVDLDGDGVDEIIVSYGNRPTGSPEPEFEIYKLKNRIWKNIGSFRGLFILTMGREESSNRFYKITSYYNMYGHQRISISTFGKVGYFREIESINPMPITSNVPNSRSPHHGLLYRSNDEGCDKPPQTINADIQYVPVLGDAGEQLRIAHMEADRGNLNAFLMLGNIYNFNSDVQDVQRAVKWYSAAAEAGVPQAQFNLGMMYRDGRGVALDYEEAEKWIRLAVKGQPTLQADTNVSDLEEYQRVAKWHRAAAEAGIPQAQFSLGMMYREGRGVPLDRAEAEKWIGMAVAEGLRKPAMSGRGWRNGN